MPRQQEPDRELEREQEREQMVSMQIESRGVLDARVLAAMRAVPRHRFVPRTYSRSAYDDRPLPIGHDQTISQPYIVAFMSEVLELEPGDRVLDIGTGSGYQAAVFSMIVREVYSIEIVDSLCRSAAKRLAALGFDNVEVRCGDGYRGWPEKAPFDAILVAAAPDHIPQPLLDQLAVGGRLVLPVGDWDQELILVRRTAQGFEQASILPVRFVPMTGEAEDQ
jgi:protein-L-isoaspartate(D-aspartate) O-methyltransferase